MKKFSLIYLLCQLAVIPPIFAQSSSISGKIIDDTGEAASFATIILLDATDSSMVKGIVSDVNGGFNFTQIAAGKYQVQSSFIGYESFQSQSFDFDGKSNYQLPTITLKTSVSELDDVVIEAQRPLIEVQPDKTVFNVEGSINAQGNTALELLRKSPGVIVDNNENLVLQGKSGVQVFIDGKLSPLSSDDLAIYLKNLQSDQVDAIEVITNPSSKYDAEGNAGIINIRLIKDKSIGTNGSVSLGFRYGQNPKYNGSLNLNHRTKFFNSYGSYSLFTGDDANEFFLIRELNGIKYDQTNDGLTENFNNSFKFGTDFFINKKMTVGILINGSRNDRDNFTNARTEISDLVGGPIDSLLIASNDEVGTRDNTNYNINYEWLIKDGSSLSIDLDHGTFANRTTTFQPNTYYLPDETTILQENIFSNVTPTDIDIYTGKIDYEVQLLGGQFGMGLKSTNIKTDNTFDNFDIVNDVRVKNTDRSNNFVYTERVNATYVSWQKQISEKLNFMGGLRAELTDSKGELTSEKETDNEVVNRNYLDFFPSAGLTYNMNQSHSFRINYSERIDRPNYQDLNPFEFKLDELSFQQGNPFLRPQYSNSYGLSHTYKYTLNTSINYTVINDVSTRITKALDEKSAILTFENLSQQTNLAITISYPFAVKEWWNVYATVTGFRLRNTANIEGDIIDLTTTAMNFYGQNTFTLPKGFKMELSGWYSSPAIWAGNWTTDSQFDVSAGISKQLFNDRGSFKVSISDIFFQNGWSGESEFGALVIRGGGTWESRQIRFNFNYAFGNDQVKASRRRNTGMEEESNRAGG